MDVVLIHGMGRTPLSMMRLRRRLRRAGHNPVLFNYSPTFETLQGATGRLVKLIDHRVDAAQQYALVGHSLGTVLIRSALGRLEDRMPTACFFLAPPMVACKAARYFSRFWLYKILTGEMGRLLAVDAFMRGLPLPPTFVRIYAGIAGPRASWLPFGMEANDGILSVSEASGDCGATTVKVPALHTFIMNSAPVFDDMIQALATRSHVSEKPSLSNKESAP
jgi:pimeloyl-ACP methyl ester carboxylesterase